LFLSILSARSGGGGSKKIIEVETDLFVDEKTDLSGRSGGGVRVLASHNYEIILFINIP